MRRSPAIEASFNPAAPRLACVRPAASVHPEPGSNSPLYKMFCFKSLALISKVLFEIYSLARVEKTFSCSNTSKNAVQYITIRTISLFCPGADPSIFSLVLTADFFFSGKWCKDKCYFLNHQNFSKKIFRKFSEPFCLSLLIEAGAKVSLFSESPKLFRTFFKIFQNVFLSFRGVFLSRSGCKDKGFSRQIPNNSGTFFRQFRQSSYTRLWISELVPKVF